MLPRSAAPVLCCGERFSLFHVSGGPDVVFCVRFLLSSVQGNAPLPCSLDLLPQTGSHTDFSSSPSGGGRVCTPRLGSVPHSLLGLGLGFTQLLATSGVLSPAAPRRRQVAVPTSCSVAGVCNPSKGTQSCCTWFLGREGTPSGKSPDSPAPKCEREGLEPGQPPLS